MRSSFLGKKQMRLETTRPSTGPWEHLSAQQSLHRPGRPLPAQGLILLRHRFLLQQVELCARQGHVLAPTLARVCLTLYGDTCRCK